MIESLPPLPASLKVVYISDGLRCELPNVKGVQGAWIWLVFLVVGIALIASMWFGCLQLVLTDRNDFHIYVWPALILVPLLILYILLTLRMNICTKIEFVVGLKTLEVKTWHGKLASTICIRLSDIQFVDAKRLPSLNQLVSGYSEVVTNPSTDSAEASIVGFLQICCKDDVCHIVASHQSWILLKTLAPHLRHWIGQSGKPDQTGPANARPEAIGQAATESNIAELSSETVPTACRWILERDQADLTMILPPAGVLRWRNWARLAIGLFLLLVAGFCLYRHQAANQPDGKLVLFAVAMVFAAFISFVLTWRGGQTTTTLKIDRNQMTITWSSPFSGDRQKSWNRHEIAGIRAGLPLFSGHMVQRMALFVLLIDGTQQRVLEDDHGDVVVWLAGVLRKQLHLDQRAGAV